LEEEKKKRPETEQSRAEDVVRAAEDKEKGNGDVEMAAVEELEIFWTCTKIFVYKIFLAALTCYIKKMKQNGTK
jgi:hypothetical protein